MCFYYYFSFQKTRFLAKNLYLVDFIEKSCLKIIFHKIIDKKKNKTRTYIEIIILLLK